MTREPPPVELPDRVRRLDAAVRASEPTLCAERALLVTRFFRRNGRQRRRGEPMVLTKARALADLLRRKQVHVYPGELLVGSFTSHRVGGGLYPELHGVAMLEDLFRFDRRAVNPFRVRRRDRARLLSEVLPYWLPRALPMRAFPPAKALRFVREQLDATTHLINETGGVSHFVPDYAALIARGTDGLRADAAARREGAADGTDEAAFLDAVRIACDGLDAFADGYRREIERAALREREPGRRAELDHMARICGRVPRRASTSLHEALQSILFAQIALNLESLDNAVSPGRLDQVLLPLYERDLASGALDRAGALELLGCFAVKLCEILPLFSARTTRFHGGLFNGQVVVVGGVDRAGADATNDLSMLLLELMDALRTRQPNYHARLHAGSPPAFRERIARALAGGAASPAVYNDDVIVPVVQARGATDEDARDYATVGCVEPVVAGKSFQSTDAALFNLPLHLELALNEGRRFGARRRTGASTLPAEGCGGAEALFDLFRTQIRHGVARMTDELQAIERANARLHPTPLTSALLDGCVEHARDATAGGARYNGSGVQGVGAVEVGDSLAAVDAVVGSGKATLAEVVGACRTGFEGADALRARLARAPKYGNDDPRADRWVGRVMEAYADAVEAHTNTRGGRYVAGFYSVTSHVAFGEVTGALPSGRRAGEPFSSGLSPGHGRDRKGPTASLRSAASLPLHRAVNGVNFNLSLSPAAVPREGAAPAVQALVDGGLSAGCMQMQVNVLDPSVLVEAMRHPGSHPGLIVRVSGYSAYFDDLSPDVQQEVIDRLAS